MNTTPHSWRYLARKPKSVYKQLFIKDRWISARTLYGMYVNEEAPMTPQEIAADYDLPLEAVQEAIAYCESDPPEIVEDYAREEAWMKAAGISDPDYCGKPKLLTAQEIAQLKKQ